MVMKKNESKRKFMKDSERLLEIIFVLHHVLSGMPSRGSEYSDFVFAQLPMHIGAPLDMIKNSWLFQRIQKLPGHLVDVK